MGTNRPWLLKEVTLKTVRDTDYSVAVLPIGATEPHGLHLPYGNDAMHGEILAGKAAAHAWEKGARVIVLPIIPYGVDSNLMGFPLAMHVRQSTINQMVEDLLKALEEHGIRKLVIFNSHGGNEFKSLLRDFYGRTEVFVSMVNWWMTVKDVANEIGCLPGDHADDLETSVALALYPGLVNMEDAAEAPAKDFNIEGLAKGWASVTRPFDLATENCAVGDSRQASPEKGEKLVAAVTERIGNYLVDLAAAEIDDKFPFK